MFTKSLNVSSAADTAMKERGNSVVMDFIYWWEKTELIYAFIKRRKIGLRGLKMAVREVGQTF